MSSKRDLTILLALKDREIYTQRWLDQNVFPEFSYVIADGSLTDKNEKICSNISLPNVLYIRDVPDTTYPIYIQKRLNALKKINTRFVMYADNDDFLLRDGLNKMMDYLSLNPEVTLLQGTIGLIEEQVGKFSSLGDWAHFLNEGSAFDNIKMCLTNYFSLFYCLSETSIQRKIFELFAESGTESPYLVEAFQTYFSIAMSNYKVLPVYYYARLRNPVSSQNLGFSFKHKYDACLDPNFHYSFFFLAKKLSEYIPEVDEKILIADLREFQIKRIQPQVRRIRDQLLDRMRSKLKIMFKPLRDTISKGVSVEKIPTLFNQ